MGHLKEEDWSHSEERSSTRFLDLFGIFEAMEYLGELRQVLQRQGVHEVR